MLGTTDREDHYSKLFDRYESDFFSENAEKKV
jgi:hypothetical protein